MNTSRTTALLAAVAGGMLGLLWLPPASARSGGAGQITPEELAQLDAELPDLHAASRAFRLVAKIARPGVVHIRVTGGQGQPADVSPGLRERLREHFGDQSDEMEEQIRRWREPNPPGAGSGIVLDPDGHVLTNNHVVAGREQITVVLHDEREFPATVVGTDPKTDLAVLKITAADLQPLKFGDSNVLDVGDWVVAVGSPFGLTQTVTHGIVSAKGRTSIAGIDIAYQDFIQTDAAINPGNSGGPLLNLRGEVVGVNTAIATLGDGYNAGVAFTIPSNMALKVARQLKAHGAVQRGWLGVSFSPVEPGDMERFGLPGPKGVVVGGVVRRSPSDAAGVEVEDAIIALNDVAIEGSEQLRTLVADLPPNERVRLKVIRDGQERTITVRLGLQPDDLQSADLITARDVPRLGLQARTLRPGMQPAYATDQRGVLIVGLDSRWREDADVGLRDLIVACNGKSIGSVRDLNEALRSLSRSSPVRLTLLEPTGDQRIVTVQPPSDRD